MNYCQRFTILLFVSCCFATLNAYAITLTGSVIDGFSNPLPYSSVYIKGSSKGTTANADGRFTLELEPGKYTIFCTHVGYQSDEKEIEIKDKTADIFFRLYPVKIEMKDVVVKANAEDPAYAIIRQAIKTRPQHLNEVKAWQVEVYMKGIIRTVAVPKSIFGIGVTMNGEVIDSSGKGIIYLSESLTKYSRRLPNTYKEDIVSAKVSGSSQGFGFNSPNQMEVNLYENNITLSGMNSRGFVSPIANNALGFYSYKYEGTFYQNGVEINHIRVIPKRLYEPCFAGYINIIENSWRIHSIDLVLTKTAQLEIVDSLRLQQQMFPVGQQFWMPQQTTFFASFGALGFKANANFAAVYSDYNLDPVFDKKSFGKVIRTADTSANKKSLAYWETIRPVPLTEEEYSDYRKKDTLEQKYNNPRYLDSLDRKRNRVTPLRTILSGVNITRRSKKMSYSIDPLIEAISYNTVEGLVVNIAPRITHYGDTGSYTITPFTPIWLCQ